MSKKHEAQTYTEWREARIAASDATASPVAAEPEPKSTDKAEKVDIKKS